MTSQKWLIIAAALTMGSAHAASQEVTINQVDADGKQASIGTIQISETEHGLLFTPQLSSLEPGQHGFHVHENGSCEPADKDGKPTAAQAAGGHYDPQQTGKHLGPYEDGHLGDLPALHADSDGNANYPVLAPRIKKLDEIKGRALMIHAGGDNHADTPEPLGGGGARTACGVI
ncbi:copper/Zinc superoxide dismutase [Pseudomonas saudimassiliensis]|uniref:Superoxide dismutase [Cu-Zn] n=1 Tax=Pseudomonas saudimassiliensis TaxID=1461581 RepID=A0A078MEC6_9PSED|nr:superoxide dismutase family protein [Pseudomonas saudimassiliensis]CEA04605.1 copper/Zinc superoxide dismutase [Pseudomonas saudimassiliensis]CEF26708.1 copper/Zinc superoxide dismutase [Pseudomonas saudimassiliensis]